ncbi:MAG: glycosyltransferase family 4 protein [Planctomycetota bacterium]
MRVAFVSGMKGYPWGGSEELWSQAALELKNRGVKTFAYVNQFRPRHSKVSELLSTGIRVVEGDPKRRSLGERCQDVIRRNLFEKPNGSATEPIRNRRCKLALLEFQPDLVCISNGAIACGLEWMQWCLDHGLPYVTVCQANSETCWPSDRDAQQLRHCYENAEQCYFVSHRNRELFELQVGKRLENSEVVQNPIGVRIPDCPVKYPDDQILRLACVGRLEPTAKGQDILLQALSLPQWRERKFRLEFYGNGASSDGVKRMAELLGLRSRVQFRGHVSDIRTIWECSHALVLPSRYEGLPLAVVEAMACGRAAIVTDVAGNTEIVTDGDNGFVAESATVKHFAEALERAWQERKRLRAMGQMAHQSIKERYTADPAVVFADKLSARAKDVLVGSDEKYSPNQPEYALRSV